jgi:hypothetical protein
MRVLWPMNLSRIATDAKAVRALSAWLGAGGKPADHDTAAARMTTCFTCPHNIDKKTVERAIGKVIRDSERVRHAIGAILPGESALKTCDVCNCHLPLKIWIPLEHLSAKGMPEHCWVAKESKAHASPS